MSRCVYLILGYMPTANLMQIPVDIDCTCTDPNKIRELQRLQAAGQDGREEGTVTTVCQARELQAANLVQVMNILTSDR